MLDLDVIKTGRLGSSARRERLTGILRGQKGLEELGLLPIAQRRSRGIAQPITGQQKRYYTNEDEALHRDFKRRKSNSRPEVLPGCAATQLRHRLHPLFWWGIGALFILGFWQLTTSGLGWWAQHVTDSTYGSTQGDAISAVLGGGDSAEAPSKIIAWNNSGQVDLIIVTANDPAKAHLFTGPILLNFGVPDPRTAVIHIESGHFTNAGHTDLKITVWADSYIMPFQRYFMIFLLAGNGKGGFQQTTPGQK